MPPTIIPKANSDPRRATLLLIFVTLVWGVSFVVIKAALAEVAPFALMSWRFLLASCVMTAIALVAAPHRRTPGLWRDGCVLGLLLGGGMALQISGQLTTTASKAAFLTGIAVILTPFAAYARTRKLPTAANALGILFAAAGFFLLAWPPEGTSFDRGDGLVLACSIVFAFYVVEMAERTVRHDSLWLTAVQLIVVTIVSALLAFGLSAFARGDWQALALAKTGPPRWEGTFLWSVLYLGTFGTVGTFLSVTWSQRHMSAMRATVIYALEPVAAALLAAWFLSEHLGARGIAGSALVLAGIAASEFKPRNRAGLKPAPTPHRSNLN